MTTAHTQFLHSFRMLGWLYHFTRPSYTPVNDIVLCSWYYVHVGCTIKAIVYKIIVACVMWHKYTYMYMHVHVRTLYVNVKHLCIHAYICAYNVYTYIVHTLYAHVHVRGIICSICVSWQATVGLEPHIHVYTYTCTCTLCMLKWC